MFKNISNYIPCLNPKTWWYVAGPQKSLIEPWLRKCVLLIYFAQYEWYVMMMYIRGCFIFKYKSKWTIKVPHLTCLWAQQLYKLSCADKFLLVIMEVVRRTIVCSPGIVALFSECVTLTVSHYLLCIQLQQKKCICSGFLPVD
jgi:hypothetical protein